MSFRLSRLAQEDIALIYGRTFDAWSEPQAIKYVSALLDELEEIKSALIAGGCAMTSSLGVAREFVAVI